jgi:hypothetical protein
MYRIALDYYNVFDKYHYRQHKDAKDNTAISTTGSYRLHCYDVWTSSDLPWSASLALQSDCLFSGTTTNDITTITDTITTMTDITTT